MNNKLLEINQTNFMDTINNNDIVIVKFGAPWCGPCKGLEPLLIKLSKEYESILFTEINVDNCPSLAAQFKIRSIPTTMAWKNNEVQWTKVGLPSFSDLEEEIKKL